MNPPSLVEVHAAEDQEFHCRRVVDRALPLGGGADGEKFADTMRAPPALISGMGDIAQFGDELEIHIGDTYEIPCTCSRNDVDLDGQLRYAGGGPGRLKRGEGSDLDLRTHLSLTVAVDSGEGA
jgi:hypothetical protein